MYGLNILRGELLLDREYPAWLDAINLDRLNLMSTRSCVLGQVEGSLQGEGEHSGLFADGLNRMGLLSDVGSKSPYGASYHGFDGFYPHALRFERDHGFDGSRPHALQFEHDQEEEEDEPDELSYPDLTIEWSAAIADRRNPESPDAPAYAYDAGMHHASCVLVAFGALTREENTERKFTVEHALDRLAADLGVSRADADTASFPVPVIEAGDMLTDDGRPQTCDTCLQAIEP